MVIIVKYNILCQLLKHINKVFSDFNLKINPKKSGIIQIKNHNKLDHMNIDDILNFPIVK